MQLSLAVQGIGLGIVPRQVFQVSANRKGLAVLRLKDFAPSQDLWIVRPRNNGARTTIIDTLRKVLLQVVRS